MEEISKIRKNEEEQIELITVRRTIKAPQKFGENVPKIIHDIPTTARRTVRFI